MLTAEEALERLKKGNQSYLNEEEYHADVSRRMREKTSEDGQHPYAVIISCSDSRVIPESIFDAGIGDLFVIRVAGNVIDSHQLGSIEYAVDHLGSRLVVVLGHDQCGAVAAALHGSPGGHIASITDVIRRAAGEERDPGRACRMNIRHTVQQIAQELELEHADAENALVICGAVYHIATGEVEFEEEEVHK